MSDWKMTLYGELLNATNHNNRRFTGLNAVDARTGRAFVSIDRTAPIIPALGATLEF